MSVLIKGMKMPENCWKCEIKQYDEYEEDYVCPFSGVLCLSIGRQDSCLLVALPEKHGWLIDFDALIEKYWDGNSMMITEWDLKDIKAVIEAEDGE